MATQQQKMKPIHLVLIVVMTALSIALFLFKDKITPDQNAAYRDEMSRYVETSAVVTAKGYSRGQRGPARVEVTVQFKDSEGELQTETIEDNGLQWVSQGDTITVWYDPEKPYMVESDGRYKEIMRIK